MIDKHGKLMLAGSERTTWGMGDGSMLNLVPTELGWIGGLICWEKYMPLARSTSTRKACRYGWHRLWVSTADEN
jgi:nitrilase